QLWCLPTSTLFPYTTLFRSRTIGVLNESHYFSTDFQGTESTSFVKLKGIGLEAAKDSIQKMGFYGLLYIPNEQDLEQVVNRSFRSEEHTSELQSRENLVCRL